MKTVTTIKKPDNSIKVAPTDYTKLSRGHQPHRSGGGKHRDQRRQTRQAANRLAFE